MLQAISNQHHHETRELPHLAVVSTLLFLELVFVRKAHSFNRKWLSPSITLAKKHYLWRY